MTVPENLGLMTPPLIQGVLFKRSPHSAVTIYQRRACTLENGVLSYTSGKGHTKTVDLLPEMHVQVTSEKRSEFTLSAIGRVYHFRALNKRALSEWTEGLKLYLAPLASGRAAGQIPPIQPPLPQGTSLSSMPLGTPRMEAMLFEVILPEGAVSGDMIYAVANGKEYSIEVPEGAEPGMALVFESKQPSTSTSTTTGAAVRKAVSVPSSSSYQHSITTVRERASTSSSGVGAVTSAAKRVGEWMYPQRGGKAGIEFCEIQLFKATADTVLGISVAVPHEVCCPSCSTDPRRTS